MESFKASRCLLLAFERLFLDGEAFPWTTGWIAKREACCLFPNASYRRFQLMTLLLLIIVGLFFGFDFVSVFASRFNLWAAFVGCVNQAWSSRPRRESLANWSLICSLQLGFGWNIAMRIPASLCDVNALIISLVSRLAILVWVSSNFYYLYFFFRKEKHISR